MVGGLLPFRCVVHGSTVAHEAAAREGVARISLKT